MRLLLGSDAQPLPGLAAAAWPRTRRPKTASAVAFWLFGMGIGDLLVIAQIVDRRHGARIVVA
jgi:hypothetical protein